MKTFLSRITSLGIVMALMGAIYSFNVGNYDFVVINLVLVFLNLYYLRKNLNR